MALAQLRVERLRLDRIGDDGALDHLLAVVHAGAHVRHDVLVPDVH